MKRKTSLPLFVPFMAGIHEQKIRDSCQRTRKPWSRCHDRLTAFETSFTFISISLPKNERQQEEEGKNQRWKRWSVRFEGSGREKKEGGGGGRDRKTDLSRGIQTTSLYSIAGCYRRIREGIRCCVPQDKDLGKKTSLWKTTPYQDFRRRRQKRRPLGARVSLWFIRKTLADESFFSWISHELLWDKNRILFSLSLF